MSRILVLFASIDGQAARVAERIAASVRRAGHEATVLRADAPGIDRVIEAHDAVVIGGGVRYGKHVCNLESVVRANRAAIEARPNAFFSVSMSAAHPGATAQGYIDAFVARTGWKPRHAASFGGALRYTHYNPFIRLLMRLISGSKGGETDTSRDYEYTDWPAVERFAVQAVG